MVLILVPIHSAKELNRSAPAAIVCESSAERLAPWTDARMPVVVRGDSRFIDG